MKPELVPKVWGGYRLAKLLGEKREEAIGEAWLLSDHPKAPTRIANGERKGCTLEEVLSERFPLLLKLIESREALSIQVHPDDAVARELEGEAWGKSEAWYVLESERGSVGLGFAREPKEKTAAWLATDAVAESVGLLNVKPGDLIYVPSGEIHFIGGGVLLAEVQQSSDLTYRIHDWGRSGRELHLQKAQRALNWEARANEELLGRGTKRPKIGEGWPFELERVEWRGTMRLRAEGRAKVFLPLAGRGKMLHRAGSWEIAPYHCWLIPAGTEVEMVASESLAGLLCSPVERAKPVDNGP